MCENTLVNMWTHTKASTKVHDFGIKKREFEHSFVSRYLQSSQRMAQYDATKEGHREEVKISAHERERMGKQKSVCMSVCVRCGSAE